MMIAEHAIDPGLNFSANDYVIGILLNLSPELEYVRIAHPQQGYILVSPKRGEYISCVLDVAEFFKAEKSVFEVTEIFDESFPVNLNMSMENLLWEATLQASQGRLIEGLHKYDVVQFERWPNLTRVSVTPNVMRICALLTRFPSGTHLAQAILRVKSTEIYSVCSAAKVVGIMKQINKKAQAEAEEEGSVEVVGTDAETKSGKFLGRLFAKLSGL